MSIRENYQEIMEGIEQAALSAGRKPEEITLLAVTKFVEEERIIQALECGVTHCGESRAQELTAKLPMFARYGAELHLIGQLQTNKVKYVIGKVKTIQSVDRLELAEEISRLAVKNGLEQNVLIEVNVGGEAQKGGAPIEGLDELIQKVSALPGIGVEGLMCIPPVVDEGEARSYFARMRRLFDDMAGKKMPGVSMKTLSMGMSGDYRAAIAEGSNMVRIGTALFGARQARPGGGA